MAEHSKFQHRLDSLKKAIATLDEVLALKEPNEFEQDGAIQRFEFTFELAWKCLKDYFEEQGMADNLGGPKNVLQEAFAAGLIKDGDNWMKMMKDRNLMSHTYDQDVSREVYISVKKDYAPMLRTLRDELTKKIV